MPSHSTSVRLAPEEPMPRREMPCVVGCATIPDDRRNRLKPGTVRRRSSRLSPGVWRICLLSSTETDAGVSAAIFSITVMLVRTGAILSVALLSGCGVCAWTIDSQRRIARTKQTRGNPPGGFEGGGVGAEDNLKSLFIDWGSRRLALKR